MNLTNMELDTFMVSLGNARKIEKKWLKLYKEAKDQTKNAFMIVQEAYDERQRAYEAMQEELATIKRLEARSNKYWDDYRALISFNDPKIKLLLKQADEEHQEMKRCFRLADQLREKGVLDEASIYMLEAYDHDDARNKLNAEVKILIDENRAAKEEAQRMSPKVPKDDYLGKKEVFEKKEKDFKEKLGRFREIRAKRDYYQKKMDSARIDCARLKMLKKEGRM